MKNKKIILESGQEFYGINYGQDKEVIGEIIFNTSMVGYQEIITDPANYQKIIVLTYPIIGSYGINNDDNESDQCFLSALIVRDYNDFYSNFRANQTLKEKMISNQVPLISNINTRSLVKIIRENGTMLALITDEKTNLAEGLEKIQQSKKQKIDYRLIGTKKSYLSTIENPNYKITCIDLGSQESFIDQLNFQGFDVEVISQDNSSDSFTTDALVISDGPGHPDNYQQVIAKIKKNIGKIPIFGFGLGQFLIAIACDSVVVKMKFGHHGSNYPVIDQETKKIVITSQNHLYCLDRNSIKGTSLLETHRNLIDGTIEGIESINHYLFAIAYVPNMLAGPDECQNIYQRVKQIIERFKGDHHA